MEKYKKIYLKKSENGVLSRLRYGYTPEYVAALIAEGYEFISDEKGKYYWEEAELAVDYDYECYPSAGF